MPTLTDTKSWPFFKNLCPNTNQYRPIGNNRRDFTKCKSKSQENERTFGATIKASESKTLIETINGFSLFLIFR